MLRTCLALCVLLLVATPSLAGVRTEYGQFVDAGRDGRVVPYKLYLPDPLPAAPSPVIVFSHGLGGSVEAAPYLGQALAEAGYIGVFIQHPGTDESLWKGKGQPAAIKSMLAARSNAQTSRARFQDLPFVIDQLEQVNTARGPLAGHLDMGRVGMAGHSYGARSVMVAAGESNIRGATPFKEPPIKAAVALSPNVPDRALEIQGTNLQGLYRSVEIPLFHITGTNDQRVLPGPPFDPAQRALPYENIGAASQYLLIFKDAEHMDFGGRGRGSSHRVQAQTARAAILFFDAYLREDVGALTELRRNFSQTLAPGDRFAFK